MIKYLDIFNHNVRNDLHKGQKHDPGVHCAFFVVKYVFSFRILNSLLNVAMKVFNKNRVRSGHFYPGEHKKC